METQELASTFPTLAYVGHRTSFGLLLVSSLLIYIG